MNYITHKITFEIFLFSVKSMFFIKKTQLARKSAVHEEINDS